MVYGSSTSICRVHSGDLVQSQRLTVGALVLVCSRKPHDIILGGATMQDYKLNWWWSWKVETGWKGKRTEYNQTTGQGGALSRVAREWL